MASSDPPKQNKTGIKRVRVSTCRAKVIFQTDADGHSSDTRTFECQLEKGHLAADQPHKEHGFVFLKNGDALEYNMTWTNIGKSARATSGH